MRASDDEAARARADGSRGGAASPQRIVAAKSEAVAPGFASLKWATWPLNWMPVVALMLSPAAVSGAWATFTSKALDCGKPSLLSHLSVPL